MPFLFLNYTFSPTTFPFTLFTFLNNFNLYKLNHVQCFLTFHFKPPVMSQLQIQFFLPIFIEFFVLANFNFVYPKKFII